MSDDKTINLTATINNQQYTVSYDIEEVKRIYDKLGISPATSPDATPAATPAATPDATPAATPVATPVTCTPVGEGGWLDVNPETKELACVYQPNSPKEQMQS